MDATSSFCRGRYDLRDPMDEILGCEVDVFERLMGVSVGILYKGFCLMVANHQRERTKCDEDARSKDRGDHRRKADFAEAIQMCTLLV